MSIYKGDSYSFTLFLVHADGTNPTVTSAPVLQIIRLADVVSVLGAPAAMTATDGTKQLWKYTWNIGAADSGEYVAVVSYAADGHTFSSTPIEKIRVGDTFIIDTVALDGTVAKDFSVAKDATVAKATDLAAINPNTSTTILAIKTKTDNLPGDPVGLSQLGTVIQNVEDIHDVNLANQSVDKTQNPAVYTVKRADHSILAQFQIVENSTESSKTKI